MVYTWLQGGLEENGKSGQKFPLNAEVHNDNAWLPDLNMHIYKLRKQENNSRRCITENKKTFEGP
jgi:hypothetical protein